MAVNQVMSPGDDAARFRNSAGSELNNFGSRSDSYNAANSTQSAVNQTFGADQITPEPNVLDNFASYTYSASLYLMTIEDFQKIVDSGKKEFPGSQLIVQTAGAPVDGRNKYFSLDYYIERIKINSKCVGGGTGLAHNANDVEMTIAEPNGVSFLGNLEKAIKEYIGDENGQIPAGMFLLIIRFYGYDEAGNQVQCGKSYGPGANSVVEKYYPLMVSDIKFKLGSKIVEYEVAAKPMNYEIPLRQSKGSLPMNVELGGRTVREMLIGTTAANSTKTADGRENQSAAPTTGPKKASSSSGPKQTVRKGLVEMLNELQKKWVKEGKYTVPDEYAIEFTSDAIAEAKVTVHGGDTKGTGMPVNKTAAEQTLPSKQAMDSSSRLLSFTAGVQLVQIIDQILRNSTYIIDQANTVISEKTGEQVPNTAKSKSFAWYKINLVAVPTKYDPKRNDYAYKIKFVISPYRIDKLISSYFDVPTYKGAHKQYNYWFTGQNTSVLSYEQDYNYLYKVLLTGSAGTNGGTFVNNVVQQCYSSRSGQSSQGAAGAVNEISASASDYLYSMRDYSEVTLQIIGDPAWLQQGEVFSMVEVDSGPFLSDGTINFDSGQVLFEVLFNKPVDYDLQTGLMDPNNQAALLSNTGGYTGASRQSVVYVGTEIVSEFVKGRFTQTLHGKGIQIFPDQSFKEPQNFSNSGLSDSPSSRDSDVLSGTNNPATAPKPESAPQSAPTGGSTAARPNPRPVTTQPPQAPTSNGDLANLSFAQRSQIAIGIGSNGAGFTGGPISPENNRILDRAVRPTRQLINRET